MQDMDQQPTEKSKLDFSFHEGDCLAFFLANDGYDSFINCIIDFGYSKREAKQMAHSITDRISHHILSELYVDAKKEKQKSKVDKKLKLVKI